MVIEVDEALKNRYPDTRFGVLLIKNVHVTVENKAIFQAYAEETTDIFYLIDGVPGLGEKYIEDGLYELAFQVKLLDPDALIYKSILVRDSLCEARGGQCN